MIAFWYGLKTRCQTIVNESDYIRYLTEWRDITLLRLFEGFLEAAPQTVLQLYILASQKKFILDRDWLTATSAVVSIISLSWAIVAYSHMLRICLSNKGLSVCGYMFQILYRLFMVSSRVAVLVLFASVYPEFIFVFVFVHCAVMFAWLSIQDTVNSSMTEDLDEPFLNKVFTFIVSVIYLYCFLTVQKKTTRGAISIYYGIMFTESAILMAVWFPYRTLHGPLMYSSFGVVFGGFIFGILCMMLYYKFFHPSQDITEGWLFCECFRRNKNEKQKDLILDNASFVYPDSDQELVIINIKDNKFSKISNHPTASSLKVDIELSRPISPSKSPLSRHPLASNSTNDADTANGSCLLSNKALSGFCHYGACQSPAKAPSHISHRALPDDIFDSKTELILRDSGNSSGDSVRGDLESGEKEIKNGSLQVRMSKQKDRSHWDHHGDLMTNKSQLGNLMFHTSEQAPQKTLDRNGNTDEKKPFFFRQGSKDDSYISRNTSVPPRRASQRAISLPEKDFIRQNLRTWVKEKTSDKSPVEYFLANRSAFEMLRYGGLQATDV